MAGQEQAVLGFDFGNHKGWTPYVGDGGTDFFAKDGYYRVTPTGSSTYWSQPNNEGKRSPMIKIHGICVDEDGNGLRIVSDLHLGGEDKNGADMGRQFMSFLHSCGSSLENLEQNAQKGVKVPDSNAIVQKLIAEKRVGVVEIVADTYDGKDVSRVNNWVGSDQMEKVTKANALRRERRKVTGQASNAKQAAGFNTGGGQQAAANGQATPAQASTQGGAGALPNL
jgi:hypothetical protein